MSTNQTNRNRSLIVPEFQARQGIALASQEELDSMEEIYAYSAGAMHHEFDSWTESQGSSLSWEDLEPEIQEKIKEDVQRFLENNNSQLSDQLQQIFEEVTGAL